MNPEGSETLKASGLDYTVFESSVNPEGSETFRGFTGLETPFESSVNPEGSETAELHWDRDYSLRVV